MNYPSLFRRYLSTLLDLLLLWCWVYAVTRVPVIVESNWIAAAVIAPVVLTYEPMLTAFRCTIGQWMFRLRVRMNEGGKRISIPQAYGRRRVSPEEYARVLLTLIACSVLAIVGCASTVPKSRWASLDGDERIISESQDFRTLHRTVKLNGHDLYNRRSARVKDEGFNCLRRQCRLRPGSHTIEVQYSWWSAEVESEMRNDELVTLALSIFGYLGAGFEALDQMGTDNFQLPVCNASVSFDAMLDRNYLLKVVHKELIENPESFQIIDADTGDVVGSAIPICIAASSTTAALGENVPIGASH